MRVRISVILAHCSLLSIAEFFVYQSLAFLTDSRTEWLKPIPSELRIKGPEQLTLSLAPLFLAIFSMLPAMAWTVSFTVNSKSTHSL